MIGGKPMIVPVIAFDVTYHWDGEGEAFGQNAGSFVIGREQGASGSEKLAPLPLDRASYTVDRPGARARSEEHTSELQSLMRISYAVFCLKKKKTRKHMMKRHHI